MRTVSRYNRWTGVPTRGVVSNFSNISPFRYTISRVWVDGDIEAWDNVKREWQDGRALVGDAVPSCRLEVCLLVGEYE